MLLCGRFIVHGNLQQEAKSGTIDLPPGSLLPSYIAAAEPPKVPLTPLPGVSSPLEFPIFSMIPPFPTLEPGV